MRTLVAVPAKRDMLHPRAVESVLNLKWDSEARVDTVFLVDGDDHGRWENLCRKLKWARTLALQGGYDALLTIESDIIVPEDALEKLAAVDADVVYGLFVLRFGDRHWNAAMEMRPQGYLKLLSSDKEAARAAWGKVIECEGHGQGICLIRRHVLDRIGFRNPKPKLYAQDWFFSFDCQEMGFKQMIHLGVVCGHIEPTGEVFWPDPGGEFLYRMEQ